jgi:putative ABC transport system ATP-binding protein
MADTPTETARPGPAVRVDGLTKVYGEGETEVRALAGVGFEVERGEFVVLLGPSGSGKTTCLNLIGAIEEPSAGSLTVDGVELVGLAAEQRTDFRRDHVGFVFQFYNLVPTLTALENVQLVAELTGAGAEARSTRTLDEVGISDRADHFPAQLSGGEQQRVAIARALAKQPALLLCDEPTGALDLESGRRVLALLRDITATGRTVLLVTHNSTIAHMADRVLHLRDGRLVSDTRQPAPKAAAELEW